MFKLLFSKIVATFLSPYLEDYDGNSLNFSISGDKIELKNVKLKPAILEMGASPVKLLEGNIKSLIVHIPFTKLSTEPVIAEIDGVQIKV